jgi:far upstream element-binding protein
MIIGRGGENLKRIETDSRARVQFDPAHQPGDAERRVTVSGSQENVRAAKDMIMRVVEEESERKVGTHGRLLEGSFLNSPFSDDEDCPANIGTLY